MKKEGQERKWANWLLKILQVSVSFSPYPPPPSSIYRPRPNFRAAKKRKNAFQRAGKTEGRASS